MIFSPLLILFTLKITLQTSEPVAVVKSDSMRPYINKGDTLIIRGIKNNTYIKDGSIKDKKGDVIVFNASSLWSDAPAEPIVHRVVGKWKNGSEWFFTTKGDANDVIDPAPISKERIIGVVKEVIRYVGWSKIILMEVSFTFQAIIFSALMVYLFNKFRHLKF